MPQVLPFAGRLLVILAASLWLAGCNKDLLGGSAPPRVDSPPVASPTPPPRSSSSATSAPAPSAPAVAPVPSDTPSRTDATPSIVLAIQPLGAELPDADVRMVEQALHAFYDVRIQRLDRIPLPDGAKNDARTRYRAEKLLTVLEQRLPAGATRILGLTGADISTTKGNIADWGILGLATIDGAVCVISKFRTTRGTRTAEEARIRLGKVAVHEIGHTLGLEHCPTVGCLMEDARGTVLTCDREYDLCPRCREQLERAGYRLPSGTIPWPRPGP